MSRTLYQKDVEEILIGATFLGAGGGGSLTFGNKMIQQFLEKGHPFEIELLELDEIQADDYGVMVACMGSPVAMMEGEFGPDAVYAFKAFQKAFLAEGKNVKYLYSGEMGGFNTFVPMLVSLLSHEDPKQRVPFINTDANGRAVPELNTCLTSVRGFPPSPIGMGNGVGDMVVIYPTTDKAGEAISRTICQQFDNKIGFATWGLSRDEMKNHTCEGFLTIAQKVGKAIVHAKESKSCVVEKLQDILTIREMCRGEITDIKLEVKGGFDVGTTTIKATDGNTYFIDFQNENLLVRDDAGKVYITVPELICLIDEDYNPLTNADTKVGMNIQVSLSPAHSLWWSEDKKAYTGWRTVLDRVGFTGDCIQY